jgi:hypothetical protein
MTFKEKMPVEGQYIYFRSYPIYILANVPETWITIKVLQLDYTRPYEEYKGFVYITGRVRRGADTVTKRYQFNDETPWEDVPKLKGMVNVGE